MPDRSQAHSRKWQWPEATSGQRLTACVIDQLLLVVFAGLAGALLGRTFVWLVTASYYPLMHILNGQTFGKQIIGIRVVNMKGGSPQPGDILLRETIGRLLATLFLGIGYLRIIWRRDKRGWHDSLAGTHVIALKEAREIGFLHVAGSMVALTLILASAMFYARQFTSLPMKAITQRLAKYGWQAEGINGNQRIGFSIRKLYREDESSKVEFNNIKFKFQVSNRTIRISQFYISKALITVKQHLSFNPEPAQLVSLIKYKRSSKPPSLTTDKSQKTSSPPMNFEIEKMNIGELKITVPQKPTYLANRVYVSDLSITAGNEFKLGRLWMQSNMLDLNLEKISFNKLLSTFHMEKEAYVLLKPSLFPKHLQAPVDLKIKIDKYPLAWSGKVSAFRDRLTAGLENNQLSIQTRSLTPAKYFRTDLPLRKISLTVDVNTHGPARPFLTGHLRLKNEEFHMRGTAFVSIINGKSYVLIPNLKKLLHPLSLNGPGFFLGSSDGATARNALAQVYFRAPVSQLSPGQISELDRDLRHFADLPTSRLRRPANKQKPQAVKSGFHPRFGR